MRQGLSLLAIVALLAQGPATAVPPQGDLQLPDQGLCRLPDALPRLGAEEPGQQRSHTHPISHPVMSKELRDARVTVAPPVSAPSPPPAADAAYEAAEAPAADLILTGTRKAESKSRADASRHHPEPDVMPPPHRRRPPQPQPGQLTAGEHDDLLNPQPYADYVRRSNLGQWIPELPRLDTARVLTVAVNDRVGRPVPFAPVELACADGSRLKLSTMADGTVTFFPELDRLGQRVWLRTPGEDWREVTFAKRRGGTRIDFTVARQAPAPRKLDLLLTIDTTGSMGDEIRYLQSELAAILDSVRRRHPDLDLRVGFVFYRDLGDDYVTATVPLTSDINAAQAELSQRWAGGGGDYPEAMDQALIRAAGQAWRPDAVKTMLLVADAPPHDDKVSTAWRAAEHLRASRVHIVPVAASGVADKAEYVMRAMAAVTQSRYTFLTDDSGIGNPHAPPAIDCYLVTRLDALLLRVIDSQLSGRRVEPGEQEVIRTVGDYDKGRCIIPRGVLQES